LEGDSNRPYENFHLKRATESYPASWRYQSAFVFSYQPKWVPGLFLGMTRTLQRYQQDIGLGGGSFLKKYIPVLTKAFQKKNEQTDDAENTDQLASFFFRWLLPKSKLEVYAEWGYNDYKQNIRDYVMDATHSAAYIVGIQKLYSTSKYKLLIGAEITKTAESPSNLLRGAGNWYVHGGDNGYTHLNQILGAGVGYGADLQSAWLKISNSASDFSFRIFAERVQRDPNNFQNKWIDMIWQVEPIWKSRYFTISSSINYIRSKNYLWEKNRDVSNWHTRLSFYYSL
jgi:hypothetical protein